MALYNNDSHKLIELAYAGQIMLKKWILILRSLHVLTHNRKPLLGRYNSLKATYIKTVSEVSDTCKFVKIFRIT
jgi:hypothetical protein